MANSYRAPENQVNLAVQFIWIRSNLKIFIAGFGQVKEHSAGADNCEAHHLHGGAPSHQPTPPPRRPERGIYQGVCLGGRQMFRAH